MTNNTTKKLHKKEEQTLIILEGTFKQGFGVAPFSILRNPKIPNVLKPLYLNILSYAWYNAKCFPGQETLAEELGVSGRTIRKYLAELEKIGLVSCKRRGLNKTNIYYLNEIPDNLKCANRLERNERSYPERNERSYKVDKSEADEVTIKPSDAKASQASISDSFKDGECLSNIDINDTPLKTTGSTPPSLPPTPPLNETEEDTITTEELIQYAYTSQELPIIEGKYPGIESEEIMAAADSTYKMIIKKNLKITDRKQYLEYLLNTIGYLRKINTPEEGWRPDEWRDIIPDADYLTSEELDTIEAKTGIVEPKEINLAIRKLDSIANQRDQDNPYPTRKSYITHLINTLKHIVEYGF